VWNNYLIDPQIKKVFFVVYLLIFSPISRQTALWCQCCSKRTWVKSLIKDRRLVSKIIVFRTSHIVVQRWPDVEMVSASTSTQSDSFGAELGITSLLRTPHYHGHRSPVPQVSVIERLYCTSKQLNDCPKSLPLWDTRASFKWIGSAVFEFLYEE
jgi:hypothetical protein